MSARPSARRRRSLSTTSSLSSNHSGPSTSSTHRPPPQRSPRRAAPGPDPDSDASRYSPLPFNRGAAREDQPPTSPSQPSPPAGPSDDHRPSQVARGTPRRHSLRYDPVTDAIETQTLSQRGVPLPEQLEGQSQITASNTRDRSSSIPVVGPNQARKAGGGRAGRVRKSPSPRAGSEATATGQWSAREEDVEDEDDIYPSPKRRRLSELADDALSDSSRTTRERLVELAYRPGSEASLEDTGLGDLSFKESSPPGESTPSQSPSSLPPSLEDRYIPVEATPFIPSPARPAAPEHHPPPTLQFSVPFIPPAPPPPRNSTVVRRAAYYPAYNANGDRIGLDRTLEENTPGIGAARHYRKKTLLYPPPGDEFPHVMNINMSTEGSSHSRQGRRKTTTKTSQARAKEPSPPPPPSPEFASPQPDSGPEHEAASSPEDEPDEPEAVDATEEDQTSEEALDPEQSLRARLGLGKDGVLNLYALKDPGPAARPEYVYTILIQLAILGSPKRRLTLGEIYTAFEERFQWYRENSHDVSWKNSIRHRLSLCQCFQRVSRPITEPGKGSFWTLDWSQGNGDKRPRKRNKKPTKAQLAAMARESGSQESEEEPPPPPPAPKPRAIRRKATPKEKPWVVTVGALPAPPTAPQPVSNVPQRTFHVPQPTQPPTFDESMLDPLLRDPAPVPPPTSGHDVGSGQTPRTTQRNARKGASPYQQADDLQGARTRARTSSGPELSASPPAFTPVQPVAGPSYAPPQPVFGQSGTSRFRVTSVPSTIPSTNWLPYMPRTTNASTSGAAPPANMLGLSGGASQPSTPTAQRPTPESFRRTSEVRVRREPKPARKLTTDQDGNLIRSASNNPDDDDDDEEEEDDDL